MCSRRRPSCFAHCSKRSPAPISLSRSALWGGQSHSTRSPMVSTPTAPSARSISLRPPEHARRISPGWTLPAFRRPAGAASDRRTNVFVTESVPDEPASPSIRLLRPTWRKLPKSRFEEWGGSPPGRLRHRLRGSCQSQHDPGSDPKRDVRHHGGALWRNPLKGGRVEQSNFHDYQIPRMNQAPAVRFISCRESPGGMGEAGTSAIVPRLPRRSLPQLANACARCQSTSRCFGRCDAARPKVNLKQRLSPVRENGQKGDHLNRTIPGNSDRSRHHSLIR
jgi:hypothetical protein